jgi:hypothetical protein
MANLSIKDFDSDLLHQLKLKALEQKLDLKDYISHALTQSLAFSDVINPPRKPTKLIK